MLAWLDDDTLDECLRWCSLQDVYNIKCCCSSMVHSVRKYLGTAETLLALECRIENVPLILRDAPRAPLPIILNSTFSGKRIDANLYDTILQSGNRDALCYVGVSNMTPNGLAHALATTPHLAVVMDCAPRWKKYLRLKVECRCKSLNLQVYDHHPEVITRWLRLTALNELQHLSIHGCMQVDEGFVRTLPTSLKNLCITSTCRCAYVGILDTLLTRLRLDSLRLRNCFPRDLYVYTFIASVFMSEHLHVPRVIGLSLFPSLALAAAIDAGCNICMCSSEFEDEAWACEYVRRSGRCAFCSQCCI